MLEAFNRHPADVGESYGQHLGHAAGFGVTMIGAGLACLVHAIFPFWFEKTASDCIKRLHARMSARLRNDTPAPQSQGGGSGVSLTPILTGAHAPRHPAWSSAIVGVLAVCAWFMGKATGFPAPVLAAVAGMGLGLAGLSGRMAVGLTWWARPGLKIGVAMLGAQIAWAELAALGLPVALASGGVVMASLGAGALIGTLVGLPLVEALIAASAVSICGASAAMAAASALPETDNSRRTTALVVVGVNLLSTFAMVAYPVLAAALGFSPRQIGVFLGLSIHDVAQVVAAGSSVSPATEASAALAKLSRILWLGPVIITIALAMRSGAPGARRFPVPPLFVWGFAGLMLMRSLGLIPEAMLPALATVSQILLLGGVCAISAQVAPRDLLRIEARLAWTLISATAVIALLAAITSLALVT